MSEPSPILLSVLCILLVPLPAADGAKADGRKLNVLFIALDDLNTQLGSYANRQVRARATRDAAGRFMGRSVRTERWRYIEWAMASVASSFTTTRRTRTSSPISRMIQNSPARSRS